MHEQDRPNVPAWNNAPLLGFVVGAAVGAGIALLVAPASGAETRRRIGVTSRRLRSRVRNGVDHARSQLSGLKHDVEAAVASGRESFVRERDARSAPADGPRPARVSSARGDSTR